jgi:PAS domain S-box-containing protein
MKISDKQKFTEIIFDNIRDGIVMLDRDYRILAVNSAVEKWIQRDTSDIIAKDCRELFHENSWVCPHCAARVPFETGEPNIVTQKVTIGQDTFYAELSAYPVVDDKGQVIECAVFIQDITDRMLCHDEVLRLFNEVTNTKEYIESIIENSADAIITSDMNGIIISWNRGAEEVYGFEKSDVLGKFLPHVLDSQTDPEREYNQRIRNGEVIKRIETSRKKKDGSIVSVSLTLSPIKNPKGEVIGISSISRDISEKKNVEKELIRRNQELSRLFFISSAMRGTLELESLLRMVLAAVTMGDGLGFNRAILFLVDEERNVLKGALGVGPDSHEEAFHIWDKLSLERKTLHDVMHEIENGTSRQETYFDKIS